MLKSKSFSFPEWNHCYEFVGFPSRTCARHIQHQSVSKQTYMQLDEESERQDQTGIQIGTNTQLMSAVPSCSSGTGNKKSLTLGNQKQKFSASSQLSRVTSGETSQYLGRRRGQRSQVQIYKTNARDGIRVTQHDGGPEPFLPPDCFRIFVETGLYSLKH